MFRPCVNKLHPRPISKVADTLQWRHNGHDGVSNHQPHHCLLNRLFGYRSKKTSKLRVTGLCTVNSPGTGEFPPVTRKLFPFDDVIMIWSQHFKSILFKENVGILPEFHYISFHMELFNIGLSNDLVPSRWHAITSVNDGTIRRLHLASVAGNCVNQTISQDLLHKRYHDSCCALPWSCMVINCWHLFIDFTSDFNPNCKIELHSYAVHFWGTNSYLMQITIV